jgi:hypothetical protein
VRRRAAILIVSTLGGVSAARFALAQSPPANSSVPARPEIHAARVTHPPVIDGVLDDEAWTGPAIETTDWRSYNPLYGETIPQRTTVWVAYDDDNFYFAFRCDDPDPSRIKTSIARRDNAWNDDWVGLSLDSLGSGQLSYHMMVNPSGIQMDMLNSIAGGEDTAPDWIWDSAGRVTASGYTVEIRLPLQSIRFKGGTDVHMGLLFWRRVSRTGISVAWPPLEPGKWVFEKHATLILPELGARPPREVIPSTTFSMNRQKQSSSHWSATDKGDIGVSTKIGLTSTLTLDATVNPDFSQVESDAFQVQVNQRFPVYFPEKRPFFMEGAGIFTLAGTLQGDQSLLAAVNTRNIVDPIAGVKLTGSAGRLNVATLTAVDEATDRTFNVARAQYSTKPGSYVGAIGTDTESSDGYNRVAGGDLSLKMSDSQRLNVLALESVSDAPTSGSAAGFGTQVRYSYNTRVWNATGHFEHYDQTFRMDTAFLNRVGDTNGWGYLEYNLYPSKERWPWLRRIQPFTYNQATRDRIQRGDELLSVDGVRLFFTRQGFFRYDQIFGHEPWAGQRFKTNRWRVQSNAQLFRWLRFYANANAGFATFYDPIDPFQGRSNDVSAGITFQPSGRFSESVDYERVAFDRASTGERVYTVRILNTKTTYQFTSHFFLRGIVQFDSSKYRVLTDFLASYELRPGTVFYAGYGSLIEQRAFRNGEWVQGAGRYETSTRQLFLKVSYLHRF